MQQLSGLDAVFLELEDAHQALHVSQLLVLQRPADDPDFAPYPAWRRRLAQRMHRLAPLRRRLVEVPLGLDHPWWVTDPGVDLDFHVRHSAVAPPGDDAALDALVARLVAGPMDRDHPLWVSHVIEGLTGDRFAILTMIHHAAVDGVAAADLLALMLDDAPEAGAAAGSATRAPAPPPHDDARAPEPSTSTLLARAAWHGVTRPARGLVLGARAVQSVARATGSRRVVDLADRVRGGLRGAVGDLLNTGRSRDPDQRLPRLPPVAAPPTVFNAPVSRYRRFAHRSLPLSEVVALGEQAGATVNDVVVALCAGGLRRWLRGRGELPDAPLSAAVPMSLRTGEEDEPWTNRVSITVASLPTDVAEPAARLAATRDALGVAKALFRASPGELLPDALDLGGPALGDAVGRLAARWAAAGPALTNLVISNVPGPQEPLWLDTARMAHYFPVSAIADGQGLNITVQSYVDQLDLGFLACARLMPDLDDLADAVASELAALQDAVEARP